MSDANSDSISVYARIKGGSQDEESVLNIVSGKRGAVQVRNIEFQIDDAFDGSTSQSDIYATVGRDLVERVIEGYNATILAYGQTGSGKTYTMLGPEGARISSDRSELDDALGVVPRACDQLFKHMPKGFTASIAYMEVYNDAVNDLYAAKGAYMPLREDPKTGSVEPDGLTRRPVGTTKEVMAAVAEGDKHRVVAAMAMNPRSSRGHGLILVDVFNADGEAHGRLTLVDLAGMESSKKSPPEGASNVKARKEEAKRINQSLLALSSVVSALATKGAQRIPYRDSKLTRLLQTSLGGNCKSALVVTLRGEKANAEEGMNVLRFAQRAKSVQATVIKNEDLRAATVGAGGNKRLAAELDLAKGSLAAYEQKLATADSYQANLMAEVHTLMSEMRQLQKENADSKVQLAAMQAEDAGRRQAPGYVEALERRVIMLEDENRLLRQRDIMHRLGGLEDASDPSAPKFGFNKERLSIFQPLPVGGLTGPARRHSECVPATKVKARGVWAAIRFAMHGHSRRVHPGHSGTPDKRASPSKARPKPLTRQERAAVTIQKHVRRWLVQMEMELAAFGYGDGNGDDWYY